VAQTTSCAARLAVVLTPPELGLVPDALQRPDGSSKFCARKGEAYATQELLDAAAATDAPTAPMTVEADPAEAIAAGRKVLSGEQAAAVPWSSRPVASST
jgi:hypothetical protein